MSIKSKKKISPKIETKEATGSGGSGGFETLFSVKKKNIGKKVETKEATGASSSGSYETPSIWAKTMNKKDWRGASKPLIPGGKFVEVKKKCKTFPYCNQGDINAVTITKNESVQDAIKNVSKKMKISEERIKKILEQEMVKLSKRTK